MTAPRLLLPHGPVGLAAALSRYGWTVSADEDEGADVVLTTIADDRALRWAEAGTPVLLLGALEPGRAADAAGLLPGHATLPAHEVRVRAGRDAGQIAARWPDAQVLLRAAWPTVDKVADDVQQLLTANSAFTNHPVATWRESTSLATVTLQALDPLDPVLVSLLARVLRHVTGQQDAPAVRIGMLGYGAIGHEHALAIGEVQGLELTAVCDPNPTRIDAARTLVPDVRGHADGEQLLGDPDVDLVIVSTPPNTHADWVLRCLQAGRHVVVEKPFCLTVEQADRQMAAASEAGLALAVYQNRRWDVDYLALKAAVRAGRLGEVFHLESFVGGYDHPCNFWHSDAEISGGHIYDWGSHYLDQILDLLPQQVEWVSASAHKRVWHDVTNADHTRVLLHFEGGIEAEFTASDLAAARKPKYYVLGTEGAVVGDWREERIVSRSSIGLVELDRFAASDSPADMTLFGADGARTSLAVPAAPRQPFHRELADALLWGAPMSVTPAGSRRNIAVMEAATLSAADGGRPVVPQT